MTILFVPLSQWILVQNYIFLEMQWDGVFEFFAGEPLFREESTLVTIRAVAQDGCNRRACGTSQYLIE